MKKILKALMCMLVIGAIAMSFISCAIINVFVRDQDDPSKKTGYTAGGLKEGEPHKYAHLEYHWVETYDEVVEIIEALKASGNKIPNNYIPKYDNDVIDAKYVFIVNNSGTPNKKAGEEWYSRKFNRIEAIGYFGFLEKVSIEKLEFSSYDRYRCIWFISHVDVNYSPIENMEYDCRYDDNLKIRYCEISSTLYHSGRDDFIGNIYYENIANHNVELPENFHEDFINSLVYIGD